MVHAPGQELEALLLGRGILAPEDHMKAADVGRVLVAERVADLVEEGNRLVSLIAGGSSRVEP